MICICDLFPTNWPIFLRSCFTNIGAIIAEVSAVSVHLKLTYNERRFILRKCRSQCCWSGNFVLLCFCTLVHAAYDLNKAFDYLPHWLFLHTCPWCIQWCLAICKSYLSNCLQKANVASVKVNGQLYIKESHKALQSIPSLYTCPFFFCTNEITVIRLY